MSMFRLSNEAALDEIRARMLVKKSSQPRELRGAGLSLTWPPTANKYWRHPGNGVHLISKEGRRYRANVKAAVWTQLGGRFQPMTGRVDMHITACPPDRRRRDLDNLFKSLNDALQRAGVYNDDSQIDRLCIERGPVGSGLLTVVVREIGA